MNTTQQFRTPSADGRMIYPLDRQPQGFSEWLTPVTEIRGMTGFSSKLMIVVDADLTSVAWSKRSDERRTVIRYTRDRENPAFPLTVSVEDWPAFRDSFGFTEDGDSVAENMYSAVFTEQVFTTELIDLSDFIDLPANILDPESIADVDSTFTWQVGAPYLVFGEVYQNAMPGALINIRERLVKAVDSLLPHAKIWTHKASDGVVNGHVRLTYEDRRTYPVKVGRKTVHSQSTKEFSFNIPIPVFISGTNKKEAVDAYNVLLASIVDQITDMKAVVCGHCSGEGVIAL